MRPGRVKRVHRALQIGKGPATSHLGLPLKIVKAASVSKWPDSRYLRDAWQR